MGTGGRWGAVRAASTLDIGSPTRLMQIKASSPIDRYAGRERGGELVTAIAICIPARDEAAALPDLFGALGRLRRERLERLHLCLLLDGCEDDSAAIAASLRSSLALQLWIEEVPRAAANAGVARHRAMNLGLRALAGNDGLLLTTDADSVPAVDWLSAMTAALCEADVVAGRIVRDDRLPNPLQDRVEAYYDALFALRRQLDPVPWEAPITHHHAGGANMGIRAAAYAALGGFAPLASGEDARLVDDAARAGLRVRRDAASLVRTSGRRDGRVTGGLASSLRLLDGGDAAAIRVAHPADAAWQYRRHARARAAHLLDRLDLAAAAVGLPHDHVLGVARDCINAEAFAMRIVPEPPGGMRTVSLPVAERELARFAAIREAA